MFINSDGNWECEVCGATALLWGYHCPDCPVIRPTPVAGDAAEAAADDVEGDTR
jgi:hypothetical protein